MRVLGSAGAFATAPTTPRSSGPRRPSPPSGAEFVVWAGLAEIPAYNEDRDGGPGVGRDTPQRDRRPTRS